MSSSEDRIARLEAQVAELTAREGRRAGRPHRRAWRLGVVGLVVALVIPAAALGGSEFSDVPSSHKFHDDIQAIANAGITSGCGGSNYCPNGLVTRGQMAAFLNRLGALGDGTSPKVNADRVDGYHANQLVRAAEMATAATTAIPATGTFVQYGGNLTINAPKAGWVVVNFGFTVQTSNCTAACDVSGQVLHVESGFSQSRAQVWVTPAVPLASGSVHGLLPVSAGAQTFRLQLARTSGGNGTINGWYATGSAMFVPFGSTGAVPVTAGLDAGEEAVGKALPR